MFGGGGGKKGEFGVAVRTPAYRYVEYDNGAAGTMLFDERADAQETKNLADDPALAGVREQLAQVARRHAPNRGRQ